MDENILRSRQLKILYELSTLFSIQCFHLEVVSSSLSFTLNIFYLSVFWKEKELSQIIFKCILKTEHVFQMGFQNYPNFNLNEKTKHDKKFNFPPYFQDLRCNEESSQNDFYLTKKKTNFFYNYFLNIHQIGSF